MRQTDADVSPNPYYVSARQALYQELVIMGLWDAFRRLRRSADVGLEPDYYAAGEVGPYEAMPTLSVVRVDGVTVDFYKLVRATEPSIGFMPNGQLAHLVGEHGGGILAMSYWDELRHGRDYFRDALSVNVGRAVALGNERGDFVREEFPLIAFRLGARAPEFEQSRYDDTPPARVFMTHVVPAGNDGTALAAIWPEVLAAAGVDTRLAGNLVLLMAGRTDHYVQFVGVWTSRSQAEEFLHDDLPRALAEVYPAGSPAAIETFSYPAAYCLISEAALSSP